MSESPSASWRDHATATLRREGYRSGEARGAVVDLLAGHDCCRSAQEIFDELRASGRRVGIASVYRALDVLGSLQLVQRLDMGDGVARYEPLQAGGEHHHHFVCGRCGGVEPFEDATLEHALDRLAGSRGFAVEGHDVVLRGTCSRCREAGARR